MSALAAALGLSYTWFLIYLQEIPVHFAYFFVLTWYKNRRGLYPLRLLLCVIAEAALSLALVQLLTYSDTLGIQITCSSLFALSYFLFLFVCYRESPIELCLCWTGIVAAKHISGNIILTLLSLVGKNDWQTISFFADIVPLRDWTIFGSLHLVLLATIYFFLRRNENLHEHTKRNAMSTCLLFIFTFLLSSVLYTTLRYYQTDNLVFSACYKLLLIIIYLAILLLRAGLFRQDRISEELKITEQLLYQEKKHYVNVKDNIDVINMKCHDLKRQLSALQGKLTDEEIKALKEAAQIYDANIKTGNEIIDVILHQKQLYCENNGIRLSCIADGAALSFMSPSHIYALLANALENAIEAVNAIADPEKHVISFSIRRAGDDAVLEVTNYFEGERHIQNGLPSSSKNDKIHHGYGVKSMRYIAETYCGKLSTYTENDIFYLQVSFPIGRSN